MDTFRGKTVLLTGAGSGIGRCMALLLANEKADLALVDINMEAVHETQSECQAKGAIAAAYQCDMGSQADIESMLAHVSDALGPVDILINSAGTVAGKYVHEYESEGHIVNMASVIGLVAMPRMGEYVASKFAIVGFAETIRMELKKAGLTGVKTLCVCTTGVDTGLFPGYKAPRLTPLLKPEAVAREVLKAVKMGRSPSRTPSSPRPVSPAAWMGSRGGDRADHHHRPPEERPKTAPLIQCTG